MTSIVDLVVEERAGVPIARVSGEIDMSVTASVAENLGEAPRDGSPGLVLDLTDLEYLDSAGLRVLLQLAKRLAARQQSLHVVVPDGSLVANLLAMTRADAIISVHRTEPEALTALGVAAQPD